MDRFANREAVRLAFEEVSVLDAVRVRRQDGAVRTGIGLYTLNRITTTAGTPRQLAAARPAARSL